MNDDTRILKYIYRNAYWAVFIPALSGTLGNFIGVVIVGNKLGGDSLAAVGLMGPFNLFFLALGCLLGHGGTLTSSQYIGKGEHQKAKQTFTAVGIMIFSICALTAVFGIAFLDVILKAIRVPPELFDHARSYGIIILSCGFALSGTVMCSSFLRLEGLVRQIVSFALAQPIIVISVNVFLIFFMGWGLESVAASNAIGGGVTFSGLVLTIIFKSKSLRLVRVGISDFITMARRSFLNGLASASDEICVMLRTPFINALIMNAYGILAISAYSAYVPLVNVTMCLVNASSQAIVPLIGVLSCERDSANTRRLVRFSYRQGLLATVPAGILLFIFVKPVCMAFGITNAETLAYAVPLFRVLAIQLPLSMISNNFINTHNALGHVVLSNVLNIGRTSFNLIIPIIVLSRLFGIVGVWNAFWVNEVLTISIALCWSFVGSKKNRLLGKLYMIDRKYELTGKYLSFSSTGNAGDISRCAEGINDFCMKNCVNTSRLNRLSLAIEEILTLIATHSLHKSTDVMDVRIFVYEDDIILRVRAAGTEFNPLDYYYYTGQAGNAPATIEDMLELKDKLGVKMVIDTARSIDYSRTFGINNITVTL